MNNPLPSAMGGYQILYCDPPWAYSDKGIRGGTKNHYSTMVHHELVGLYPGSVCAPDATLFMWATWPMMQTALALIHGWGFQYINCAFDWVKTTKSGKPAFGLGHWTRGNSEPCLLARRGKPKRVSASVSQIVMSPRMRHSAKPPEVRERIVELMGDVPRLEMFARERAAGWTSWGNEL